MQCCIKEVMGLFSAPTTLAAIILMAASFVSGMIISCVVCKLFSLVGKKCSCKTSGDRATVRKFEKRHMPLAEGAVEIYVGNLSYDLTEDQLRKEFEAFGKVTAIRIVTNHFNNRSKGFGFVIMANRSEAESAIKALSEKDILGRKLKCNEARNSLK